MAKETHINQPSNIMTELHVELRVIASAADLDAVRTEWRAFLDRPTVTAGFFTEPSVQEQDAGFGNGGCLVLGKVHQHDDLVAIVPLLCRKTQVSVRFGLVNLFRQVIRVAKLPDFEFPREEAVNPFEVFSAIISALQEHPRLADMVSVDSAPEPPSGYLRSTFTMSGVQTTYVIQVEGDFGTYERKLASKSRKKIKRYIRKLEETAGASVHTVCYRTPEEMNALFEQLTRVWEKSWHARVGRQHVPSESYLKKLAQSGWIRAYVLVVGDQPVASVLGFQYRGSYYYEAPAYNQDWQDRSPGIVLLFYLLKDLYERDRPTRFDFGFGYGQYKEVFGTHEERRGVIRVGITESGKLIVSIQAVSDLVFKWSKKVLDRTGLLRLIKKRIREGK